MLYNTLRHYKWILTYDKFINNTNHLIPFKLITIATHFDFTLQFVTLQLVYFSHVPISISTLLFITSTLLSISISYPLSPPPTYSILIINLSSSLSILLSSCSITSAAVSDCLLLISLSASHSSTLSIAILYSLNDSNIISTVCSISITMISCLLLYANEITRMNPLSINPHDTYSMYSSIAIQPTFYFPFISNSLNLSLSILIFLSSPFYLIY